MQIKNGQTLLDAAVQSTGDAGQALQIATDAGIGLTDDLDIAANINTPAAAIDKTATVELMNKPSNIPASDDGEVINEGIDYWRIGIDFKIG